MQPQRTKEDKNSFVFLKLQSLGTWGLEKDFNIYIHICSHPQNWSKMTGQKLCVLLQNQASLLLGTTALLLFCPTHSAWEHQVLWGLLPETKLYYLNLCFGFRSSVHAANNLDHLLLYNPFTIVLMSSPSAWCTQVCACSWLVANWFKQN